MCDQRKPNNSLGRDEERPAGLIAENRRQTTVPYFPSAAETLPKATSAAVYTTRYPPRENCHAKFLIDGSEYFLDLWSEIQKAKSFIWVCGWQLSPSCRLTRSSEGDTQIGALLRSATQRGVKVRVLLYDDPDMHEIVYAESVASLLKDGLKAESMEVLIGRPGDFFTYHQKCVVIDGSIAYIGGLDLAYGRWDTPTHDILDGSADLYNPGQGLDGSQPWTLPELFYKNASWRMPFHDIQVKLSGEVLEDLCDNFVERWNQERNLTQRGFEAGVKRYLLWKESPPFVAMPKISTSDMAMTTDSASVKIVRSIVSSAKTESDILKEYLRLIQNSTRYVYIENQFFISQNDDSDSLIKNSIISEIAKRVTRAIMAEEKFFVAIVLPFHPEGKLTDPGVRFPMFYQRRTLLTGICSLFNRIVPNAFVEDKPNPESVATVRKYLKLFSLCSFCRTVRAGGDRWNSAFEQIYVHSKLMIIDDRELIIGSANINDRSLLGSRDVEIAAVIRGHQSEAGTFDGQRWDVSKLAADLRRKLWAEHLGEPDPKTLADPFASLTRMIDCANVNTKSLADHFPNFPGNQPDLSYQEGMNYLYETEDRSKKDCQVQGHLVWYPINWLRDSLRTPWDLTQWAGLYT